MQLRLHTYNAKRYGLCLQCGERFQVFAGGRETYCGHACSILHRTRPLAARFWAQTSKDRAVPASRPELGLRGVDEQRRRSAAADRSREGSGDT